MRLSLRLFTRSLAMMELVLFRRGLHRGHVRLELLVFGDGRRELRERRHGKRCTAVVGNGHFKEAKALDVEPVGEVERHNGLGLAAGEAVLRREKPDR